MFNLSSYYTQAKIFTDGDTSFIFHPCRPLVKSDFPIGANVEPDGANVYQLHPNDVWEPTNYLTDFDWTLTGKIPGVVYGADGFPRLSSEGKYNRVDFDIKFTCDESDKDPDPEFTHAIAFDRDSNGNIRTQVTLMVSHASGCSDPSYPTPTPTPIFKYCDFISRMDGNGTLGIDAHLNVLTHSPWGVRKTVKFLGKDMTLFYTPCGTMTCPVGYQCNEGEMESSVYLCPLLPTKDVKCQSFGYEDTTHNPISLYGKNENSGLLIEFAGHNYISKMHMTAARSEWPEGFLDISETVDFDDATNTIILESTSHEADIVVVPSPPQPGDEFCYKEGKFGTSTIKLNLTQYNKPDGYVEDVKIPMYSGKATLYYQPCGSLQCPEQYTCKGTEDSTVMLCYSDYTCRSYGMIENNVSITYNEKNLTDGFKALYVSNDGKANVKYTCNRDLPEGQIQINQYVVRNGENVEFSIETSDVCTEAPLPPVKPWYMPTPNPYAVPPEPMISPNPINFYYNDTHFIVFNLEEFKDDITEFDTNIIHGSNSAKVHLKYRPWKKTNCPSDKGTCAAGDNEANAYLCYESENAGKVCYSYADVNYDAYLDLVTNRLDDGVDLTYNSRYDTDLSIEIHCGNEQFNILQFFPTSDITYGKGLYGEVISVLAESKNACPIPIASNFFPPTPDPTPLPTPLPDSKFYFKSEVKNNQFMEINLKDLAAHTESIFLGKQTTYRRSRIHFDPDQPMGCTGDVCLGDGGKTNIWKCFTEPDRKEYCYGVGDARQSLTFHTTDNFADGITAVYGGGYSDYTTSIQFLCNKSIPAHVIDFDDIGGEQISTRRITLFAQTSDVCPKEVGETPLPTPIVIPTPEPTPSGGDSQVIAPGQGPVTGGSVFMLLIIIAAVSYLVIGLFISYKSTGKFELPNTTFWTEFGENVVAGATFIFTCGKKYSCGVDNYDAI
jgi:hypothetical protein